MLQTVLYILVYIVLYIVLHIVLYSVPHIVLPTILYTAVYTVHCTVLCTVNCESKAICVRHRTAKQIILERKLAKGFSSNIEGGRPLMSEIRYIRRNYTPKRRRLSTKLLKREAESAVDELPIKRQLIFNIVNKI